MAELADALDLGSSGVTRTGSIPASRTNFDKIKKFIDKVRKINLLLQIDFILKKY